MAPDEERREGPGFTIVDRRGRRDEEEAEAAASAYAEESGRAAGAPPPVDFAGFLLSLGTSALYHLGLVADPETGKPAAPDLALARQTIDTLELLQTKTRGNLEPEEAELLANLLTDLRMRYVETSR